MTSDAYPPIGDYAAIGDGRTMALVSRTGAVDWWCVPNFSGGALFAALLDRTRGGHCTVRPSTALFGAAHGIVLLVAILPLVPYVHPRMASDYDTPARERRLEPPGFIGRNYGYRTPLAVLVAQCVFGAVLGLGAQLSHIVPQ